jgi:hypothetical protein
MNSATSTKAVPSRGLHDDPPSWAIRDSDEGLRPWQFFVLAALACATALTWLARGQGVTAVILLSVLMATVALAGLAALRTLLPLFSPGDDRTAMVGERTRVALEREKLLTLRAIKELEFDRAMQKLSPDDFREMSGRLRARAARLMKQLDAGAGHRGRIEVDLARRMGERGAGSPAAPATPVVSQGVGHAVEPVSAPAPPFSVSAGPSSKACAACATINDLDARFCKECGARL